MSDSGFAHKVKSIISRYGLLRKDAPVLVAVSGGADSVALLAVLCELGYDVIAAHCNFHLRGEESMRDMRFTTRLAAQLGVELAVKDFDVQERRAVTGESVEMAARELRYEWFRELLDREGAQAVAVGHHREDNIETFMLNLLRGSGLAGLTGMKRRTDYVVRPLLEMSRGEIEEYLAARGLGYITDSSNSSEEYKRNKLRLNILPHLESEIPGALEALHTSMRHLADNFGLYSDVVRELSAEYYHDGVVDVARLSEHGHARILLFEILRPYGFNMTHVENILQGSRRSGVRFMSASGMWAELDRGLLRLTMPKDVNEEDVYAVSLRHDILTPVHIRVQLHEVADFQPERNGNVMYLDERILECEGVFYLRHWRHGDRLEPFGMKGSKQVSDIFCEARLSAAEKRNVWLLCTEDGRVMWIPGIRAWRHYAVRPGVQRYLRLEYMDGVKGNR
ncbi:MAG: tRNA lysidine(34) synthetase TilS [Muribaculaceae bacterium]|nr:tRNA lysidine(34) synthetase TilS [Muribaculaceae bacterium]